MAATMKCDFKLSYKKNLMPFEEFLAYNAPWIEKESAFITGISWNNATFVDILIEFCIINGHLNALQTIAWKKCQEFDQSSPDGRVLKAGTKRSAPTLAQLSAPLFSETHLCLAIKRASLNIIQLVSQHCNFNAKTEAIRLAFQRCDDAVVALCLEKIKEKYVRLPLLPISTEEFVKYLHKSNEKLLNQLFQVFDMDTLLRSPAVQNDASNYRPGQWAKPVSESWTNPDITVAGQTYILPPVYTNPFLNQVYFIHLNKDKFSANTLQIYQKVLVNQRCPVFKDCLALIAATNNRSRSTPTSIARSVLSSALDELQVQQLNELGVFRDSIKHGNIDAIKMVFEHKNVQQTINNHPDIWFRVLIESLKRGDDVIVCYCEDLAGNNFQPAVVRGSEVVEILCHNNEKYLKTLVNVASAFEMPLAATSTQGSTDQLAPQTRIVSASSIYFWVAKNIVSPAGQRIPKGIGKSFLQLASSRDDFSVTEILNECFNSKFAAVGFHVFEMILDIFSESITQSDLNKSQLLPRCLIYKSDKELRLLLAHCGHALDPNRPYTITRKNEGKQYEVQETVFMRESKIEDGLMPLLCETFKHRYNPNIQDSHGYTALMHAVANYSPDVIKELVEHPNIDLSLRNKYQQTIIDVMKEQKVDPKTMKLVQVAYERQMQPSNEEQSSLDHYIAQIQSIIKSHSIDPQTRQQLTGQLNIFAEDLKHALQGHVMPSVGMMPEHRLKLQGNRVDLIVELDPKDEFMDHLLQDGVIDQEKLVEFREYQTKRERITRFLDHLPYCGGKAYASFIAALRATMKGYLADKLEAYDPNSAPASDAAAADNMALVPVTPSANQGAAGGRTQVDRLFMQFMHAYAQNMDKQ